MRIIQSGHWDGIWHRKMRHAKNEKQETTYDGWNGTNKSRKKSKLSEKGNPLILGNTRSRHHQTSGDERKI